ncbi:MAG: MlaD family protein [Candidatus Kapaibacteriales bacterium]
MHGNRTQEIKVGIATFVALLLLLGGVIWGEGLFTAVSNGDSLIKVMVPSSNGIKPSNPVTYMGVSKGSVESVEIVGDSVLVTAYVEDVSDFEKDVSARITMLEITGGKKLEILPGSSTEKFDRNTVIRGRATADFGELLAQVSDISGDAKSLVYRIDTLAASANDLLRDGKFLKDIKESAEGANALIANANQLMNENRGRLNKTLQNAEYLTAELRDALDENRPDVEMLIDSLNFAVSNAKALMDDIGSSVGEADKFLLGLNDMLEDLKTNESALNKLMYDAAFAAKLDSTFANFGDFIELIRQHGVNVNLRIGTRP